MSEYKFILPIYGIAKATKASKNPALNVNWYRNVYYRDNNLAKAKFKKHIQPQLDLIDPIQGKIKVMYVFYAARKNHPDLDNFVGTVKKYFQDALVESGLLPDDNVNYIVANSECYGGVDKGNPRVEAFITCVDQYEINA